MPDNTSSETIKIGGFDIPVSGRVLKVKVTNKETKKREDAEHPIASPVYTDIDSAVALFRAMLTEAERSEAGNALRLTDAILLDRIKEASDESINTDTGESDIAKYVQRLCAHSRPRSAGVGKDELNKEIVSFAAESVELQLASKRADGWTGIKNADGSTRFANQDEFVLRFDFVQRKMAQLCQAIAAIETRNAAAAAKRKEKAEEAAKKAKEAAAAVAH